ncbi:MAG: transcription termination factor NusA [Candidatus Aminicenantaceae bacterium]
MKVNVWSTIVQMSKERGVSTDVIVNAIKDSLKMISSNYFKNNEKVNIHFKPEKGDLRIYSIKEIKQHPKDPASDISLKEAKKIDASAEIGKYIEIDIPSETLSRIAAQAAKQAIFQKVRSAEQEKIYNQFSPQLGKTVTGVVRRIESNRIILEANKTDILMPFKEKLKNEEFRRGDRVKAVVIQVLKEYNGPQVIVSRSNPKFLERLLILEIPEIANNNIQIKDIVRQPGERAKVAVVSNEKDVDPVGACIGVRGNRILPISKELNGEKIDIVEWSSNPIEYAKAAFSPAKINKIILEDEKEKIMRAIVPDNQLSLAIGKKGTNVRLASRLVGWKITVRQN